VVYHILIVDDSSVTRELIRRTLQLSLGEKIVFYEAGHGMAALDILRDEWVDVVFSDINMPVMNGIALVDEMASRGLLDYIPVIIVSTDQSVTRMEELKGKGVTAYLKKPFTPENIRDTVTRYLWGATCQCRE